MATGPCTRINSDGTDFDSFYSFGAYAGDGAFPSAGNLMMAKDGNIYGTTIIGGANSNAGSIYSFQPIAGI